jgi:recombination protein RecR
MFTQPLQTLIFQLSQMPTVGPKTAQRLALYILGRDQEYAEALASAILNAKTKISHCPICFNLSSEGKDCHICSSPKRDQSKICVVADPRDLNAIEKTHEWDGLYHVLGGVISPLDGIGTEELNAKELIHRASKPEVKEVIMAISPSVEGQTTTLYLGELLKPFVDVSRIAYGLSVGAELDYADTSTISKAIEDRISISKKEIFSI